MGKTVRAKFSGGLLKPTEKIDIAEGREVLVTIMNVPLKTKGNAFERAAGAWKGTINAKKTIGDYDLLIASTSLYYNLILLTNNKKHYQLVKNLNIFSLL